MEGGREGGREGGGKGWVFTMFHGYIPLAVSWK